MKKIISLILLVIFPSVSFAGTGPYSVSRAQLAANPVVGAQQIQDVVVNLAVHPLQTKFLPKLAESLQSEKGPNEAYGWFKEAVRKSHKDPNKLTVNEALSLLQNSIYQHFSIEEEESVQTLEKKAKQGTITDLALTFFAFLAVFIDIALIAGIIFYSVPVGTLYFNALFSTAIVAAGFGVWFMNLAYKIRTSIKEEVLIRTKIVAERNEHNRAIRDAVDQTIADADPAEVALVVNSMTFNVNVFFDDDLLSIYQRNLGYGGSILTNLAVFFRRDTHDVEFNLGRHFTSREILSTDEEAVARKITVAFRDDFVAKAWYDAILKVLNTDQIKKHFSSFRAAEETAKEPLYEHLFIQRFPKNLLYWIPDFAQKAKEFVSQLESDELTDESRVILAEKLTRHSQEKMDTFKKIQTIFEKNRDDLLTIALIDFLPNGLKRLIHTEDLRLLENLSRELGFNSDILEKRIKARYRNDILNAYLSRSSSELYGMVNQILAPFRIEPNEEYLQQISEAIQAYPFIDEPTLIREITEDIVTMVVQNRLYKRNYTPKNQLSNIIAPKMRRFGEKDQKEFPMELTPRALAAKQQTPFFHAA